MRKTPLTTNPCSTRWPALLLPLRLEVRRIDNDLCIRVLPDQPFVNSHRESLSAQEAADGAALTDVVKRISNWHLDQALVDQARDEWVELARRYGPQRAAWILHELRREAPTIESSEAAPVPTLFQLPQRFIFLVYQNGQLVYSEPGRDLAGEYTLLPAPSDDATPPVDGLFDDTSKWVTDFRTAVDRGLAVEIPLIPDHSSAEELQFSEIVVVGLAPLGEEAGARAFQEFVRIHHYTDGMEFLPYSTPTNNTQQTPSGHSQSEDALLASFEIEVNPPKPTDDTVSEQLARGLGLPSGIGAFKYIKGATLKPDPPFRLLVDALWPCTGDYFFSEMVGYQSFGAERKQLQRYVRDYLRPGGHFSALRVGNLPFGILPATRTKPASSQDRSGWRPSPIDHAAEDDGTDLTDFPATAWSGFDSALLKTLRLFLPLWIARAKDTRLVPRAGASPDPDDELVRILGMAPHSLDYSARPIVDQTLIGILYRIFQDQLFGANSSFEGLVPDSTFQRRDPGQRTATGSWTAAATWGYAWNESIQQRQALFQELGVAFHLKHLPPLLRAFAWGSGVPLGMHLVRVPEPPVVASETPPADPAGPPDGPETYLPLFLSREMVPFKNISHTLLFELLRRSLLLEPPPPGGLQRIWDALVELRDFPIVEFFSHTGTREALQALAAREPAIPSSDLGPALEALQGDYSTAGEVRDAFDTEEPSLFNAMATRLRHDFSTPLENGLRDLLDGLTYRLDAWWTSLAARRLAGMRAGEAYATGLHWGAYGYLEEIKLRRHSRATAEQDPGAGYIHAPTIGQASAAAVLRSAYTAHRNDPDGNAYALNLTSRRVNRALTLVDGVQQGQDLSALLGYQFERGLHDAGLDRAIDAFRTAFPISPPEEEDTAEAAEAIGARDVCDGRAIAEAIAQSDPKIDAALASLNTSNAQNSTRDRNAARDVIQDLGDSNDAVGDLLLYEGIYQAVQGNVDRAGAALDACAGLGRPPEIESVTTPVTGPNLRHRICVFLPIFDPSSTEDTPVGARAAAEPTLNAWVEQVIGDLSDISCTAHFTPDDDQVGTEHLHLGELDPAISVLDFVYLCGVLPSGDGDTEIEARLRRCLRQKRVVAPASEIRIAFDEPESNHVSVEHAMELARSLLDVLGDVTVATPPVLTQPDYAPNPPFYRDAEATLLIGRAEAARDRLRDDTSGLSTGVTADMRGALDICAEFGIPEAVLDRDDDPTIAERARTVAGIIAARNEAATQLIEAAKAASGDARIRKVIEGLQALFGEGFVILPACEAPAGGDQRAEFGASLPPDPGEERLWQWLHQVADTHPRVRRLETFLIEAEAWRKLADNAEAPALEMAQLPREDRLEWQGLSKDEMDPAARSIGSVRGVQSIVAIKPPDLALTRFTGLVIDEWTETIPATSVTTGVSFEYDQPASQAPHCFLLAVPGNFDNAVWTADHLAGIVRDTMELARARLVDLDALPDVAGLAPALMFPIPRPPILYYPDPGSTVYGVPGTD